MPLQRCKNAVCCTPSYTMTRPAYCPPKSWSLAHRRGLGFGRGQVQRGPAVVVAHVQPHAKQHELPQLRDVAAGGSVQELADRLLIRLCVVGSQVAVLLTCATTFGARVGFSFRRGWHSQRDANVMHYYGVYCVFCSEPLTPRSGSVCLSDPRRCLGAQLPNRSRGAHWQGFRTDAR